MRGRKNRSKPASVLPLAMISIVWTPESSAEAQQTVSSLLTPAVVPFQRCVETNARRWQSLGGGLRVVLRFPPSGGRVEVAGLGAAAGGSIARCVESTLGSLRGPRHSNPQMLAECLLPMPGQPNSAFRCRPFTGSLPLPIPSPAPTPRPRPAGPPSPPGPPSPTREETPEACRDGADNDDDGHIDCDDQDCEDFLFCAEGTEGAEGVENAQPTAAPPERSAPARPSAPPPQPKETSGHTRTGRRSVHVTSSPSAARVSLDRVRRAGPFLSQPWHLTPHTFETSSGMHTLRLERGGFESLDVDVPAGSRNLLINVELSRPVFEAGVALAVIGVVFSGIGIGFMAAAATNREDDGGGQLHEAYVIPGSALLGTGGASLLAGILMMILDRNRDSTAIVSSSR